MNDERKERRVTDLMALLVFAVFALCVLGVLLAGAGVYRRLVDRGAGNFEYRTAVQYMTTRIRQGDRAGGIAVEDFGGSDALVIREEWNGKTYLTRIYCHDGYIRELFAAETGQFDPEDGELLFEGRQLRCALEGRVVRLKITLPDGTGQELVIDLRSEEEAVP